MKDIIVHAVTVFMGFFAIMNPIANVSIFLGLTSGDDQKTVRAVALRALLLSFVIITIFSIAGKLVFEVFGITLPALQIAGGLIVSLIGYHMLHGSSSSVHQLNDDDSKKCREAQLSVAVSPLAMPILAGPGTIATAMNFSAGGGFTEMIVTISAFGVLCIIMYLSFIFGGKIVKYLGAGVMSVVTRLMGLVLAVIGMQMVLEGIKAFIKTI